MSSRTDRAEQKAKLLKAFDLAEGAGRCLYEENGEPCCVVEEAYSDV